jgi:hypothetical protein
MEGITSKPRAVATRPAVLDDPDPGRTAPDEPQRTDIVITAHARHLTATAVDLTSEAVPANDDLVSLQLRRDSTRITILGTLAELDDLVGWITAEVRFLHLGRINRNTTAKAARAKARPGEPVNTLASLLPPSGPEAA